MPRIILRSLVISSICLHDVNNDRRFPMYVSEMICVTIECDVFLRLVMVN